MNRLKHVLTAVIILTLWVGCGKKVDVALSESNIAFAPQGATAEVALTSNGDWSVDAYPEWLTVSPTSGKGDATLTLTAAANESEATRTGEVRVTTKDNSATLTVTQESGPSYSISVNPTAIEASAQGGTYEVTVTATCEWTVNTAASWLHCQPASGNGNATVTVTVDPNEGDTSAREADIIFAGAESTLAPLHVTQLAPIMANISVTPSMIEFEYAGGTQQVTVNSDAEWTAACDAEWITLSATTGSGETHLEVTVTENPAVVQGRSAQVTFRLATGEAALLLVRQEGAPDPHFLEVNPVGFHFGKEGGTSEIAIGCDTDWTANIDCDWASLSTTSGTGNGTLTLTVAPNPIGDPRFVEFKVVSGLLSQVLTVTQDAGDEPLVATFVPDTLYPSYTGGFEHLELLSNTSWYLETENGWITLITSSGEGDASFNIVIDNNNNPDERIGYLYAKHNGQILGTLVVVQEGKPNIFETDMTLIEARIEGGDFTIHLTSNQSWTLNSDVTWISCSPESGLSSSDIIVTVQPASSPRPRTGHIKIVGATGAMINVTVEQNP